MERFFVPAIADATTYYAGFPMSLQQQEAVVALAAEAYREDDVLNYLACGKGAEGIRHYMRILLRLALRQGWVSVVYDPDSGSGGADKVPISAAFWLRPGHTKVPWWYQFWLLVTDVRKVTGLRYLPRMLFDLWALDRAHSQAMTTCGFNDTSHVYLLTIVTREDCRKQGLAGDLMRPVFAECDRAHLHAYLEAAGEQNAHIHYPRYHFRTFGEVPLYRVGLTYPAMVRSPQASTGRPNLRVVR